MGVWDWVKRGAADVATGGLYEGYKYAYGDPANEQKKGYGAAGAASSALGKEQRDWYGQQGQTALGFYGGQPNYAYDTSQTTAPTPGSGVSGAIKYAQQVAASKHQVAPTVDPYAAPTADAALKSLTDNRPTQQQNYYDFMGGEAHKQTNQETLYNERKNGNDPAAQYEDDRAVRALNTQLAARGGYNSSRGMGHISDYYANVGAQRSHDLAGLASGADSSRLGMDTAYGASAAGASGEQRNYFGDVASGALDLSKAKADTFSHFADEGGQAYSQGQLAQIEAQLAAAGVDAATRKQFIDDMTKIGTGAGKIAKGGG